MTVNEGDNPVEDSFIDCVPFFKDGPTLPNFMHTDKLDESEILGDQQRTTRSYSIPKGVRVRWHNDNRVKLCEMIICQEKNNTRTRKIKVLGSNDTITLPQSSVELVCAPDPSSISESISDINNEELQDSLSHEDMQMIWDNTDNT